MGRLRFRSSSWCAALVLVSIAGCAPAISAGTKAGVKGSLQALNEKENQVALSEAVTSPEVQAALADVGESLTHGLVDALEEELRGANASELATGVGDRTESVIRDSIAPGVADVVKRSVEASLETAASEESLEHTRSIAAAATDAAVRSMTAALADGIREDIRPALAELDVELAPMATRALSDEELKQALGAIAYEVSREIVLGSEGALDTIQREQDPGGDGSFFGNLGTNLGIGWAALVAFVAALAIGLVALVILVVKGNAQRRHLERDSRHRESMMMALMNSVIGDPGRLTPEQRERLRRGGFDPRGPAPAASPG